MSKLIECNPRPEFVYLTIPAEYVCVYHKILGMMADFGEEMLKDCKASCTDKNTNVVECYNMFNAAVSARAIGKEKLAETLIHYIKAKINQIYKAENNVEGYVFPIDEQGRIKAFVSCNDRPKFYINSEDGVLYKESLGLGFPEEYAFEKKDKPFKDLHNFPVLPRRKEPFDCFIDASITDEGTIEAEIKFYLEGEELPDGEVYDIDYYFDKQAVDSLEDITDVSYGKHILTIVAQYKNMVIAKSGIIIKENHI